MDASLGARHDLPDEAATEALAAAIAREVRTGDVLLLTGDLGAGKTHFARAMIHALQTRAGLVPSAVPSPTFTLLQTYEIPPPVDLQIWHFDLYRLSAPDEVIEIGWEEARASGVSVVEWPDRLGPLAPPDRLEIDIAIGAGSARRVSIEPRGGWRQRHGASREGGK